MFALSRFAARPRRFDETEQPLGRCRKLVDFNSKRSERIGDGDDCCVEGGPQDRWGMYSFPLYERLKAAAPEFEEVAAFQAGENRLSVRRQGADSASKPLRSEYVTGNYFSTLGVMAFGGRLLTPDDDKPSAPPAAAPGPSGRRR